MAGGHNLRAVVGIFVVEAAESVGIVANPCTDGGWLDALV
jgi:hypothetical protein